MAADEGGEDEEEGGGEGRSGQMRVWPGRIGFRLTSAYVCAVVWKTCGDGEMGG